MSIPVRRYTTSIDPLVAFEHDWAAFPPSRNYQVLDLAAYRASLTQDTILTFYRVGLTGNPVARPRSISAELLAILLTDDGTDKIAPEALEDRYGIREIIIRDLRRRAASL